MTKDPVCGMNVNENEAAGTAVHGRKTYYVCSTHCKATFEKAPEKYAGSCMNRRAAVRVAAVLIVVLSTAGCSSGREGTSFQSGECFTSKSWRVCKAPDGTWRVSLAEGGQIGQVP